MLSYFANGSLYPPMCMCVMNLCVHQGVLLKEKKIVEKLKNKNLHIV